MRIRKRRSLIVGIAAGVTAVLMAAAAVNAGLGVGAHADTFRSTPPGDPSGGTSHQDDDDTFREPLSPIVGCTHTNPTSHAQCTPATESLKSGQSKRTADADETYDCGAGGWWSNRMQMCQIDMEVLYTHSENGKGVGWATLLVSQTITFDPKGRSFKENFRLNVFATSGKIDPEATLNLDVTCGGTCSAKSNFPDKTPLKPGTVIETTIDYFDSTTSINRTRNVYTLSYGSHTTNTSAWTSPEYRCDDMFNNVGAGCVDAGAIPTMRSMAGLPYIADNIARIQKAGTKHYGVKQYGNPLTRNSSAASKNRRECNKAKGRPQPNHKGDWSCDEYPFATTDQGSFLVKEPDSGWSWVPVTEQDSQRGYITGFYTQNRIFTKGWDGDRDGDQFWVDVSPFTGESTNPTMVRVVNESNTLHADACAILTDKHGTTNPCTPVASNGTSQEIWIETDNPLTIMEVRVHAFDPTDPTLKSGHMRDAATVSKEFGKNMCFTVKGDTPGGAVLERTRCT